MIGLGSNKNNCSFFMFIHACFLLGTRIGQASECFVYWKDPATSDTWVIFSISISLLSTCLLVYLSTCLSLLVYWKDQATSDTWVIFYHLYFSYSITDCVSSVIFQHFYFSYSIADCVSSVIFHHFYFSYSIGDYVSWIHFYSSLLLPM